MWMEISAVVAVIIFGLLSIYIIKTLIALRRTLKHTDELIVELSLKMKKLDSTVNAVSNLGDVIENKTERMRLHQMALKMHDDERSNELVEWLAASIRLGSNLIRRK